MNKNDLASRQGSPTRDFAIRAPLTETPPATARGIRVPDPRANLSPAYSLPWVREDAEGLHRLFLRAETLREQGFR